jgi:hypothetical protein
MKHRFWPYWRQRKAGLVAGTVAIALAGAGCSAPVPGTSGLTQGGQQCEVCRLRNPGDNAACDAVCLPRIEDLSTGTAAPHP